MLEAGVPRAIGDDRPGIAISDLSRDLVDAVVRFLRLLDRPSDVPVLAASLEREILWRLINGPQGAMIRQIGLADSRMSQVGRAIRWLRSHLADTVRIEDLADIAGMSVTSLPPAFPPCHVADPDPVPEAASPSGGPRTLMATREDVSEVGFSVGYDSPSQFSR